MQLALRKDASDADKSRLKRLITPDSNEHTVLFKDQIFINSV